MTRRASLGAILATSLLLAGCGGSSGAATTAPPHSGTAATAAAVEGKEGGFTTVIPAGYQNSIASTGGSVIRFQYLATAPMTEGFRSNINILREPARSGDIAAVTAAELRTLSALTLHSAPAPASTALTVDGEPARSVEYSLPEGSVMPRIKQVYALSGGLVYIITNTALPARYPESLTALDQVLAGWHWH